MAIRVALIGTGNCGSLALRQLIEDDRFDLAGVWVSSQAKVGKDAGELARLDVTTGVTAVADMEALIATAPECVVYCAMGDIRMREAMADVRRLLEAGINVVGSSPGGVLEYPWGVIPPDKSIDRVEAAAQQGGASVFVTGVDPGFVTDLLPLALASTCQSIEQIRTMEIADYATYDGGATVMFDVMGFGNQIGDLPFLYQPGVLSAAWGVAIRQLAAGMGVELDDITESVEQEPAPEDIDVAVGTIKKGTVAAVRFEIEGMVDGRPAIVVEHITRLRGGPTARLGPAGAGGRVLPCRDHRRTLLRHGHLPDQPQRRPQLRGDPGGGGGASSMPSLTSSRPNRESGPRSTCPGDRQGCLPGAVISLG